MKRGLLQIIFLLWVICIAGCANSGGYFADRGRDAADVFTVTLGVGGGAKARVGPVQAGLIYQEDSTGLRNGALFATKPSFVLFSSDNDDFDFDFEEAEKKGIDLNLLVIGLEHSNSDSTIVERRKDFHTFNFVIPVAIVEPDSKHLRPHYYFQIEGLIALGPSLRLGFNAGELVDFLLGWTTVDIFNDDIGINKPIKGEIGATSVESYN